MGGSVLRSRRSAALPRRSRQSAAVRPQPRSRLRVRRTASAVHFRRRTHAALRGSLPVALGRRRGAAGCRSDDVRGAVVLDQPAAEPAVCRAVTGSRSAQSGDVRTGVAAARRPSLPPASLRRSPTTRRRPAAGNTEHAEGLPHASKSGGEWLKCTVMQLSAEIITGRINEDCDNSAGVFLFVCLRRVCIIVIFH